VATTSYPQDKEVARPPRLVGYTETTLRDVRSAASAMGLQIQVLKASTSGEINAASCLERENLAGDA
jgi:hypothetical protein